MADDTDDGGALDFSALDPRHDAPRFDDRVRAIVRDGFEARRRSVFTVLDGWLPPALAAAAVIVVVSLPTIVRHSSPQPVSTAEILGVPGTLIDLAMMTRQPSVTDLADALDTGVSRGH